MRQRRQAEETAFGSDSFLDIIANIVGILIILIVIVGMRVAQSPVLLTSTTPDEAAVDTTVEQNIAAPEPEPIPEPEVVVAEAQPAADTPSAEPKTTDWRPLEEERPPLEPLLKFPTVKRAGAPRELVAEAKRIGTDLDALKRKIAERGQAVGDVVKRTGGLDARTSAVKKEIQQIKHELDSVRKRAGSLELIVDSRKSDVLNLKERLRRVLTEEPGVKAIRHELTPVSEEVDGEEIHYRILNGRVAHVPIMSLVELLKKEIQRNKHRMARVAQFEGSVGPIDGFSMKYHIQRIEHTPGLEYGRGYVRIEVSKWEIQAEDDLESESVEEALANSSRFVRSLRTADGDTTLTLWVYPDSFKEFRRLQAAAHRAGFRVAARPLPRNVPIAGSPQGTSSAGQ